MQKGPPRTPPQKLPILAKPLRVLRQPLGRNPTDFGDPEANCAACSMERVSHNSEDAFADGTDFVGAAREPPEIRALLEARRT